jgi:hypothetical protein
MTDKIIAVGTGITTNSTSWPTTLPKIHKYDSAGNDYQHGHRTTITGNMEGVTGIALDAVGNVYICGLLTAYTDGGINPYWPAGAYTTYKIDPNGNILWTANHGAAVLGIAVDSSGNVYTVGDAVNASGQVYPHNALDGGGTSGDRTGYYTLRKYNSAGVLQWSADHGFSYSYKETLELKIPIVYYSSYLYVGGFTTAGETVEWGALTKVNATTGAIVWRAASSAYTMSTSDITIDGSGNIYICGDYYDPPIRDTVRAYDSSGNLLYSAALTGTDSAFSAGAGISIKSDGDVLVLTSRYKFNSTDYSYLSRFSSSLAYEASYAAVYYTIFPRGLVIDDDDGVYIISSNDIYATIWKYPADVSDLDWSETTTGHSSGTVGAYCITIASVETPPLQIKLDLGIPSWQGDYYTAAPGLAIALSLGIPYPIREYAGRPLPVIFRLYLTGGTGTIELPLSSFSYRESTTTINLDAVIPLPSISLITDIEDRQDGNLLLYRGVRFSDYSEQLDLMASVAFDSIRYDIGTNSASVSVSGSNAYTAGQIKTRVISEISYRATIDGARRMRGAMDTYLHVGDTADLGNSETMTVNTLTLSVNADSATLEISE